MGSRPPYVYFTPGPYGLALRQSFCSLSTEPPCSLFAIVVAGISYYVGIKVSVNVATSLEERWGVDAVFERVSVKGEDVNNT